MDQEEKGAGGQPKTFDIDKLDCLPQAIYFIQPIFRRRGSAYLLWIF